MFDPDPKWGLISPLHLLTFKGWRGGREMGTEGNDRGWKGRWIITLIAVQ